jgi:hypothetical protein
VYRNNILVYKSQQDAQITEFILSDNCSTCFGRHYHPSSELQNNSNLFECVVGGVLHPQHTKTSYNSSTIAADNNKV